MFKDSNQQTSNQKGCDTEFWNATVCDTFTHVNHLVCFLWTGSTAGNPTRTEPLYSFKDIMAIAKLETKEDAMMMAQDEIACLNDMSLEGDIPDNISDTGENLEEALFTGS